MNICGVKWAISDGSSSVHAVATPDAHCGDMECVFVALPRYPGERVGRSAACSRTSESACVLALDEVCVPQGVDDEPSRVDERNDAPKAIAMRATNAMRRFGFFCLGGTEARGVLAGVGSKVMVGCGACVAAGCLLGEAVVALGLGACLPVVRFLDEAVAASWEALLVWAAVAPATAVAAVVGATSG